MAKWTGSHQLDPLRMSFTGSLGQLFALLQWRQSDNIDYRQLSEIKCETSDGRGNIRKMLNIVLANRDAQQRLYLGAISIFMGLLVRATRTESITIHQAHTSMCCSPLHPHGHLIVSEGLTPSSVLPSHECSVRTELLDWPHRSSLNWRCGRPSHQMALTPTNRSVAPIRVHQQASTDYHN